VFRKLAHNEHLLPVFTSHAQSVCDAFHAFDVGAYETQCVSDNGVDIAVKCPEGIVALQVKSDKEIVPGLSQTLNSQFMAARKRHGDRLRKYYILLCADLTNERTRMYANSIASEYLTDPVIHVVPSDLCITLYEQPITLTIRQVERLLGGPNYAEKKAIEEMGEVEANVRPLIAQLLVHWYEEGEWLSDREVGELSDDSDAMELLASSYGEFLEYEFDRGQYRISPANGGFDALVAVYLDLRVKYGIRGDTAIEYLTSLGR